MVQNKKHPNDQNDFDQRKQNLPKIWQKKEEIGANPRHKKISISFLVNIFCKKRKKLCISRLVATQSRFRQRRNNDDVDDNNNDNNEDDNNNDNNNDDDDKKIKIGKDI